MTCRSAFGKIFKEQDELILLVKKLSRLMEGFDVVDIFPSLKFLHVLCGMKNVHHELDAILEKIINEHKNNSELAGEGLIGVLLRLMKEGGLQFPITNDNIKAVTFKLHQQQLIGHGGNDEESRCTLQSSSRVMVNAWAIGRDHKYWNDAESLKPERFEHNSMNFVGNNFEYLPLGSGRRNCPGISFGLANVYFPVA
ncbi:hypothetical protein HAX54_048183 [Datura stramonium]|uniref:Cytochrome P450 n=1 Tax=Datura stramonium TaxID=4076 RepID=A0ABS8SUY2_DATST|nr:hypothetical protein [Datura stramonium]